MNSISRRHLIAAGAASLTLAPMATLQARTLRGDRRHGVGFGPLSGKLPLNMPELPVELQNIAFITLPDRFEYTVTSVAGTRLSDGNIVPGGHDGMATFRGPRGTTLVVRNHELSTLPLASDWVAIEDYDPARDTTRLEGASRGAALFTRGEGAWYGNGLIYFCCSNGGDLGRGQIFAYDPRDGTLMLFVESVDAAVLEAPDNIVVGPDGQLYLCEDGGGSDNIVGVSHAGELFMAVQNNFNSSEFAGACFSQDGRFMIVNSQSPGLTYVIGGPWRSC